MKRDGVISAATLSISFWCALLLTACGGNSSLTSTPIRATPAMTWNTPAALPVGAALSSTQLNATANVSGTFAYFPVAGTVLASAGITTLSATFTPSDTLKYSSASASVSLAVNPATPVVTWNIPASVIVGTALSSAQLDATANVAGAFVYSPAAGSIVSIAGTTKLSATFTPTDLADYYSTSTSISLTVSSKIAPVISWNTPTAVSVGALLTSAQLNATANIPGTFSYSPSPGSVLSSAGPAMLTVTFTPTDSVNYATASASVPITVNRAAPLITWPMPAAVTVGTALNSTQLSATANIAGTFNYSTPLGTVLTTAGTFTLTTVFTPTDTSDYLPGSATALLTVNKATPAITWNAPGAIPQGTVLSAAQLNATSNVAGTYSYTPAAGAILSTVGSTTLSTSFTPTDTQDYNAASTSVTIIVNAPTPLITWPTPDAVIVGTKLSSTQFDATANIAGTFVYSPPAGTKLLNIGATTLSTTFTPADTVHYTTATQTVTLTVNLPPPVIYAWNNVKIVGGGYVSGLYFHPTQPSLMYARTDVGGAYRWGPNDTQWVPLLDWTSLANWWQMGVEAIGLDPTNSNNVYMAVGMYAAENWDGNGAMLISNDQGKTFMNVPLPFKNGANDSGRNAGERIAVDPNLPSIVYFGSRLAGLQISTNSGAGWARSTGLPFSSTSNGTGVISVLPIAASGVSGTATPVVYAAAAGTGNAPDPAALYVTTNGGSAGSTWSKVAGQPTFPDGSLSLAPLHAVLGPNGAVYILYGDNTGPGAMTNSQLWKFVPAANWTSGSWTQITLPNNTLSINDSDGYGGLAVDPSHPGVLLVSTLDQYWPTGDVVYRSINDGANWRDVSSVPISASSLSPDQATHDDTLSPWLAFDGNASTVSTGNWATSIAVDPFNSARALYGTGQTVWATNDLTNADSGEDVNWSVGATGIEETVVTSLLAPPSGSTLLISGMEDITGFAHQDLAISPPQQMYANPMATPSSMDFEQSIPTTVVRTTKSTAPFGSISIDGAISWNAFAAAPMGTTLGGGSIALAPDGSSIVWATADTSSVWYSRNLGATWNAATGVAPQAQIVSDRVKAGVFYAYSGSTLIMSTDGGETWTTIQHGLPVGGTLVVLPDAQGDLWLAAVGSGLFANTGTVAAPLLTSISSVEGAYQLTFGAPAGDSTIPTLYLNGQIAGINGIYRSTDGGLTWIQINDNSHQWGQLNGICGDMRTFGTVYIATGGRGIIWGTSPN